MTNITNSTDKLEIPYSVGGMAQYYESLTDLLEYRLTPEIKSKIKKIIINTSVQPNSIPHIGTITTLFCAFIYAKMINDRYNINTEIELDFIECAPAPKYHHEGGDYCHSISRTMSCEDPSKSIADYYIYKYYLPLLEWTSTTSGISYSTRSYKNFQQDPVIRKALIAICNNLKFFAPFLDPKQKKLHIRTECPDCGCIDKSLKMTEITDISPLGFTVSSCCGEHGPYRVDIGESDDNYIEINTQLRDIVKGALMASYLDNGILGIMFDGADWGGAWTHRVHCESMQKLRYPLPIRLFAPLILDRWGGKLSKSINQQQAQSNPIENYKVLMEKYGDNGLKCIYDEASEWLSSPKKFFRNYSQEYMLEVLKKLQDRKMIHPFIGTHIASEFYDIQTNLTSEIIPEFIEFIKESCLKNSVKVVKDDYFIFTNGGYTLFFLLEESHLSIHTYVEHKSAFIDIFTCGDTDTINILNDIQAFYSPKEVETKQLHRGRPYNV